MGRFSKHSCSFSLLHCFLAQKLHWVVPPVIPWVADSSQAHTTGDWAAPGENQNPVKWESALTLAEERRSEAGSVMGEARQFPPSPDAPVAPRQLQHCSQRAGRKPCPELSAQHFSRGRFTPNHCSPKEHSSSGRIGPLRSTVPDPRTF